MLPEPATLAWSLSNDWLEETSLNLLHQSLVREVTGKTALVSSFGAESAVLLHLASRVSREVPVLFINTRMMFQETLDYQVELTKAFGFGDVRVVSAENSELRRRDVFGRLHLKQPDTCCDLRKVIPLEKALSGFDAWISGRKRQQTAQRAQMKAIEAEANGRLKINPLLHWQSDDLTAYFDLYDLPHHPLAAKGFTSIGCAPCTVRTREGADPRSGRWSGTQKSECGIHNRPVKAAEISA